MHVQPLTTAVFCSCARVFWFYFFERVGCPEMARLVGLPNIFQNAYFDYILAVFLVLGVAEQGLLNCIALSNVAGEAMQNTVWSSNLLFWVCLDI